MILATHHTTLAIICFLAFMFIGVLIIAWGK